MNRNIQSSHGRLEREWLVLTGYEETSKNTGYFVVVVFFFLLCLYETVLEIPVCHLKVRIFPVHGNRLCSLLPLMGTELA